VKKTCLNGSNLNDLLYFSAFNLLDLHAIHCLHLSETNLVLIDNPILIRGTRDIYCFICTSVQKRLLHLSSKY